MTDHGKPQTLPTSEAARRDELKPITALFADVVGSTSLGEKLPLDELKALIGECVTRMAAAVEEFGGVVQAYMGDGICGYFGVPIAHEDDPERAAHAALRILTSIREFSHDVATAWEGATLDVRVGINSGQTAVGLVGASDPQAVALGDTTNTAARLQSAAAPGTIAVGAQTEQRLRNRFVLEPAGTAELKGKSEPVPFWRLTGVATTSEHVDHSPLFGRDKEILLLRATFDGLATGRGQILILSGDSGLGKTRLLAEIADWATEPVLWLQGRGLSYGAETAYWPFIEILRGWLGLRDGEAEIAIRTKLRARLDSAVGSAAPRLFPFLARLLSLRLDSREEERLNSLTRDELDIALRAALVEWLEHLATDRPLSLAIDDFHWADRASAATAAELLSLTDRCAFMLVVTMQPNLSGVAKSLRVQALGDYSHRTTEIKLERLDDPAARALADSLAPQVGLDPAAKEAIVSAAEGNPLFIEELVAALIERGDLIRERTWTMSADSRGLMPAALEGLLAARIDQLPDGARRLAQVAAVIGRDFSVGLLEEVTEDSDVPTDLPILLRHEIVREIRRYPEMECTFKHGLLHEAALATLTPRDQRALHGRVGDALERVASGQDEHLERLAFYYYRSDHLDKALSYCERAARRAESLGDQEHAEELWGRATRVRQKIGSQVGRSEKKSGGGYPAHSRRASEPGGSDIGAQINGYRLDEFLGEGATGRVYKATSRDGAPVALKLLKPELVADQIFHRRFLHEARAAAEVGHEHLVRILATGESEGELFIAMEYLPGRTLAGVLQADGTLDPSSALRVIGQVGSGLDALHEAGIVHRDVKPSNIMIDGEGTATLTDFGLAKGRAYTVLTKPGQVIGTLDYLAPEILRGEEATPQSDLYALACIAFECIAGRPPFGDRSMFQVGMAHMVEEPADPAVGRDDVPQAVGWTILQALSKDPAARPPSGVAFANLLKMALRR